MYHLTLFHSKTFYATLTQFDADLAAEVHARGCPCGGRLHRADYPRKPRGGPARISAPPSITGTASAATARGVGAGPPRPPSAASGGASTWAWWSW